MSEEVLNCLLEVERTMARLKHAGLFDLIDLDDCSQAFQLSAHAVSAKAFAELGRVRHREGRYDKALGYMAEAVEDSQYAIYRYAWDVGSAVRACLWVSIPRWCQRSGCLKNMGNPIAGLRLRETASWLSSVTNCSLIIRMYLK